MRALRPIFYYLYCYKIKNKTNIIKLRIQDSHQKVWYTVIMELYSVLLFCLAVAVTSGWVIRYLLNQLYELKILPS